MTEGDTIREMLLGDTLKFACFFFREQTGNTFVVGEHHRIVCDALNRVIRGEVKKLIINIAPRYSKSLLAVRSFISQGLAINPQAKFLHLSYSSDLAQDNSVAIKDIVNSEPYQALFPTRIRRGSDTKSRWDTEQGGGLYATSTLGQITGFGAGQVDNGEHRFSGAIVIDDPIKPEDALSDNEREKVNRRFETTIRNRVNSRETPIVIIMQRLHEHDLCGYLQEVEPDDWEVVSLPCIVTDENGEERALWPFKHSLDELHKLETVNSFVFETQYMQNPTPIEGLMYREFKTYDALPVDSKAVICNYTDVADTGNDYLCSVCYEEHKDGLYVIDVLYTQKPIEYTQQAMAQMLTKRKVRRCMVEKNNGGRIFMGNVESLCREYGNNATQFISYFQKDNKAVKIFNYSNEVNNLVVFPTGWERRWPEFARDVKSFRKEGRNAHDDAPDVLSEMVKHKGDGNVLTDAQILRIMS